MVKIAELSGKKKLLTLTRKIFRVDPWGTLHCTGPQRALLGVAYPQTPHEHDKNREDGLLVLQVRYVYWVEEKYARFAVACMFRRTAFSHISHLVITPRKAPILYPRPLRSCFLLQVFKPRRKMGGARAVSGTLRAEQR